MSDCGDSTLVVHPLFQTEEGGSIPTSPLQLTFGRISSKMARDMVYRWHSRLPEITNWQNCSHCYGADYGNRWFAAAMWGPPVAREYNGLGFIELRRFAICSDAPKNTASRMLAFMVRALKREHFVRAISYQDTGVHAGTIYKASGWTIGGHKRNIGTGWNTRDRPKMQSATDKIRWELTLADSAAKVSSTVEQEGISTANMELFAATASVIDSAADAGNDDVSEQEPRT